jgi:hypothetical protein
VEVISNGRVNYLAVQDGKFKRGWFADQRPGEAPTATVARMFTSTPPTPLPRVCVKAFAGLAQLPTQASPAMVEMFRHFVWDLVDLTERELPGDAAKRAERARQRLSGSHDVLRVLGGARGTTYADPIIEPTGLAASVAEWTRVFLEELEIIRPRIAPRVLRDAARQNRYAFAAVGFFERLPWRIEW